MGHNEPRVSSTTVRSERRTRSARREGSVALARSPRVALALALSLALPLAGCGDASRDVVQVRSEKEANEILVALRDFSPVKVAEKSGQSTVFRIQVAATDFQDALEVLLAENLPRDEVGGFEAMLDSAGLIPTRTDERAKFLNAREQELEGSLALIDGVSHVRVHIALPEKDRYSSVALARSRAAEPAEGEAPAEDGTAPADGDEAAAEHPTASVVIRYNPRRLQDAEAFVERVRGVVANAVEGLRAVDVDVLAHPASIDAPRKPRAAAEDSAAADAAPPASAGDPAELGKLRKERNIAILSSIALAVLLLFALIRSMKRR